jgi:hypothetical protein
MRVVCLIALLTVACASPTLAPSPLPTPQTPAPPPVPAVRLEADLVSEGILHSEPLDFDGTAYRFEGTLLNRGTICASHVTGSVLLENAAGQLFAPRGWALPVDRLVHPNTRVPFAGCCFSQPELLSAVTYRVTFQFEHSPCPFTP